LDIAGLAGLYGGPMIMTAWYPARYTPLGYGVRQGNVAAGVTAGIYLIREFSPELKGLLRHKTPMTRPPEVMPSSVSATGVKGDNHHE